MSVVGYRARNHPQQVNKRKANDEVDDRATTQELFQPLNDRFGGFTLDVAAARHNTKCERFYTREDDGLILPWSQTASGFDQGAERVWCNPPFSNIAPWVEKAWAEHERTGVIAMLLPNNRAEQSWWQRMVEPYRDRDLSPLHSEFLSGRPRFIKKGQTEVGVNERPPFGLVLLIWMPAGNTAVPA